MKKYIFLIALLLTPAVLEAKVVNTFLCRIGGDVMTSADTANMAKFDILLAQKAHYNDIGNATWNTIKAVNPNIEIYLYTLTDYVDDDDDATVLAGLTNLGRYNSVVTHPHTLGKLNVTHNNWFLTTSSAARVTLIGTTDNYLLDFGNSTFQTYANEALVTDNIGKNFTADGIFSDHAYTGRDASTVGIPTTYTSDATWAPAMESFMNSVAGAIQGAGKKFAANRGPTYDDAGKASWLALDAMVTPPDVVMDEGPWALSAGTGAVQFRPEAAWKNNIDTMGAIHNSKTCWLITTDLTSTTSSGTDNWSQTFTFWDVLWYGIGSYLVGKNEVDNNSYFGFTYFPNAYNRTDTWFDEYDHIDLGSAVGTYATSTHSGHLIYRREYANGYVYVNPNEETNVTGITFPGGITLRQLTHATILSDPTTLTQVTSINLNAHRAAILYKIPPAGSAPATPTGLSVVSNGTGSVNVSWNAVETATNYHVWMQTGGTGDYVSSLDTANITGTINGLTGDNWSFKVSAYNAYGESALSSALAYTVVAAPTIVSVTSTFDTGVYCYYVVDALTVVLNADQPVVSKLSTTGASCQMQMNFNTGGSSLSTANGLSSIAFVYPIRANDPVTPTFAITSITPGETNCNFYGATSGQPMAALTIPGGANLADKVITVLPSYPHGGRY